MLGLWPVYRRVPADGHYFFVLGSENEVQTNFVRVRFDLDKKVYDVEKPLARCSCGSEQEQEQGGPSPQPQPEPHPHPQPNLGQPQPCDCSLPLRFMSADTLVLEVPVDGAAHRSGQDHDQDHMVAVTTCEPRTALYIACVLALPALIVACAFN